MTLEIVDIGNALKQGADPEALRQVYGNPAMGPPIVPSTIKQDFGYSPVVRANELVVGKGLRVKFGGLYTSKLTVAVITAQVELDGTVVGRAVCDAISIGQVDKEWGGYLDVRCTKSGAAGQVFSRGKLWMLTTLGGVKEFQAGVPPVAVDTTVDHTVRCTVQATSLINGTSVALDIFDVDVVGRAA